MSIGFLLSSASDAVIWRGPKKNGMIRQFLSEVDWGTLDYLILDTPPGTSDEHLSATTYLKSAGITGAILVTTPQEVSLLDVRKEIDFCKKVKIPILGIIENMSIFVCPKCKVRIFNNANKIFVYINESINRFYFIFIYKKLCSIIEYCRDFSGINWWWQTNVCRNEP